MQKTVRKTGKAKTEEEKLMADIVMALEGIKDCLSAQTILLNEVVAWIHLEPEHEC